MTPGHVHVRAGGVSLLLDTAGTGLPRVLHWGRALPGLDEPAVAAIRAATRRLATSGTPDEPFALSVVPEQAAGWLGTPGIVGHRAGRAFSPALVVSTIDVVDGGSSGGAPLEATVTVRAEDTDAGLGLVWALEMFPSGLVRTRAVLTNDGEDAFDLQGLELVLPVPREAREILDFTGRHLRERSPQRHEFVAGTHLRESRRARSHDGTLLLLAGAPGFGYQAGEVWGVHVGWSGNTRTFAEREMPSGQGVLGGGELLLPGEVSLAAGEHYATPWLYASYGDGLNELSGRFHAFLRSRPQHPGTPRKALINVWEAVYFDHDLDRLKDLADRAAAVGLERYVLDDGWFRNRRSDDAGLGDWYVDEEVWPAGLHPLTDYVTGKGLEYGIWFEPEMITEDSDLARAHPEWILRTPHRMPPRARQQQVLDLAIPEAWQYVYDRIDAILSEYPIAFVKWDHNRDLLDAGRQSTGGAGVHEQTLATYRLIEALREAHPEVELESCAGGGGRADLGIVTITDRIWTSDCIDPLERQTIEAGTGLLIPPELMGSHIASPHSHTTGRHHDLSFRAATAMFGHLGVEWDLTTATDADLEELAAWVAAYQQHRALLHGGTAVRTDDVDPALRVRGVVSADRGEAIYAVAQVATGVTSQPGQVRLPGLDPELAYRVEPLAPGNDPGRRRELEIPAWWADGVVLPGVVLATVGLQAPSQHPEHTVLLHATAL